MCTPDQEEGPGHGRHAPKAAGVVLVRCGDYRTNGPHSAFAINELLKNAVDAFTVNQTGRSHTAGRIKHDLQVIPGPAHVLATRFGIRRYLRAQLWLHAQMLGLHSVGDGRWIEKLTSLWQIKAYVELHGQETIVLASHWDCGREGEHGQDMDTHIAHAWGSLQTLRRALPEHNLALMMLHVDEGKIVLEESRVYTFVQVAALMDRVHSRHATAQRPKTEQSRAEAAK